MEDTKSVIHALPLIADALGRKYGVKVLIGGEKAYTDGRNIHIPALPLGGDASVLNLARGYLDHEAAHLRSTDFEAVQKAAMKPVERNIWNILEDYMVEHKLAAIYPGCGENFKWLIRKLFLKEKDTEEADENSGIMDICNWLLFGVRSFAVPELENQSNTLADRIDAKFPGLKKQLEALMQEVPDKCVDTAACIGMAHRIYTVIENYADEPPEMAPKPQEAQSEEKTSGNESNHTADKAGKPASSAKSSAQKQSPAEDGAESSCQNEQKPEQLRQQSEPKEGKQTETMRDMLADPAGIKSADIGELAGEELEGINNNGSLQQLRVAIPVAAKALPLSEEDIAEIRQKTVSLRTRLAAMLQSSIRTRNRIGRSGRIDAKRLAKLAVADSYVFVRTGQKQGVSTAIHILLDVSYSMQQDDRIRLACLACYAVAETLHKIAGIGVEVTSFPCGTVRDAKAGTLTDATVGTVFSNKERFHNRFLVACNGGTPMAEALWWVLQKLNPMPQTRKIVLILSDGMPDGISETLQAVAAHYRQANEVYGIGIKTEAMKRLLPDDHSRGIYDLQDLAPAMFEMLGATLLKPKGDRKCL